MKHPARAALVLLGLAACDGGDDAIVEERAMLLPNSRGAGSEARPLPDLVIDAAYLRDTISEDTVEIEDACLLDEGCATGLGQRRVVRFGTRTGNVGTADLVLGPPAEHNPYWTLDTCQKEYDLAGFVRYELLSEGSGRSVSTGGKNGFCVRDSEPWAAGGPSCDVYDCGSQGISRGCADNYGTALKCQWIDITRVPAGAYTLRVTLNPSRSIAELDYANDVAEVELVIANDSVRVAR